MNVNKTQESNFRGNTQEHTKALPVSGKCSFEIQNRLSAPNPAGKTNTTTGSDHYCSRARLLSYNTKRIFTIRAG